MNRLDTAYDILTYSLIALCFIGSGILIVRQLMDMDTNYLYHIGALMGFGLVMSMWVFKLKSIQG